MAGFFDRARELEALEKTWSAPGASLALIWGRRRTGKTSLLGHFVRDKPSVFYTATEQAAAAELKAFSEAARRSIALSDLDLLKHGDFPTWEAALSLLAGHARRRRVAVIIDEFPYLVSSTPALPSLVQRFWDHEGKHSKLKLVLCGSAQSVMEDLQAEQAPLFGRVDMRLQLLPFRYDDAALFMPGLRPAECAIAYGVLGGMPVYLARWKKRAGHKSNLRRLFADPGSALLEEGEFVLSSELPEGAGYFRILRAIASGHRTFGAIKNFADIEIQRQLERVLRLGLVERVTPVTENPHRTKRVVYRIADNFLNFWFRFVYRHRADIARGLGSEVVDRIIVPGLNDYMGEPWEEMCREFVRDRAARGALPVNVSQVGRWWNEDHSSEIDVVGLDGSRVVLVGSVKWSRRVHSSELARLRRAAEALPDRSDRMIFAIFGREAVEVDGSDVLGLTAKDLYANTRSTREKT